MFITIPVAKTKKFGQISGICEWGGFGYIHSSSKRVQDLVRILRVRGSSLEGSGICKIRWHMVTQKATVPGALPDANWGDFHFLLGPAFRRKSLLQWICGVYIFFFLVSGLLQRAWCAVGLEALQWQSSAYVGHPKW